MPNAKLSYPDQTDNSDGVWMEGRTVVIADALRLGVSCSVLFGCIAINGIQMVYPYNPQQHAHMEWQLEVALLMGHKMKECLRFYQYKKFDANHSFEYQD